MTTHTRFTRPAITLGVDESLRFKFLDIISPNEGFVEKERAYKTESMS